MGKRLIAMRTIKGPAIFLAQFAGDAAPYNNLAEDRPLGAAARLQGRADSRPGTRGCSISRRRPKAGPIATRSRASCATPAWS